MEGEEEEEEEMRTTNVPLSHATFHAYSKCLLSLSQGQPRGLSYCLNQVPKPLIVWPFFLLSQN
jgi:hypothetical protein